MILKPWDNYFC